MTSFQRPVLSARTQRPPLLEFVSLPSALLALSHFNIHVIASRHKNKLLITYDNKRRKIIIYRYRNPYCLYTDSCKHCWLLPGQWYISEWKDCYHKQIARQPSWSTLQNFSSRLVYHAEFSSCFSHCVRACRRSQKLGERGLGLRFLE